MGHHHYHQYIPASMNGLKTLKRFEMVFCVDERQQATASYLFSVCSSNVYKQSAKRKTKFVQKPR